MLKHINVRILLLILCAVFILTATLSCGKNENTSEPAVEGIPSQTETEKQTLTEEVKKPVEKKKWSEISNYVCYYGKYEEDLSKFDVAIIEPKNLEDYELSYIESKNVYTIGYLNVGETHNINEVNGKPASYYFTDENGNPVQNKNWGSYYANAADPAWHEYIKTEAQKLFDKGCSGLFLDCIDTVDLFPESVDSMVGLIAMLDESFPDKKIVANRGFTVLVKIAPYIDGVMFEDYSSGYDFENKQYTKHSNSDLEWIKGIVKNNIYPAQAVNYFPVFTLDYCDPNDTDLIKEFYEKSKTDGFIPYCSTIMLDTVWIHNIE